MPRLTDVYPSRVTSPRVQGMLRGGGLTTIWPGYTWYVDSVNGNDASTGRTAAEAFQTIAALEAAGISEWDQIGLANGSHWREQLDITVDDVTIQAYGSGAVPILDASDVIPPGDWALTGGTVNVYQATVNADIDVAKTWVNAWEDGEYLVRVANVPACDATPGTYLPSADIGAGPITLYVHPFGSTDPTIDGKTYEATVRQYGLNAQNRSGITVNGITTQKQLHENGSLIVGRNGHLVNCNCDWGSKHNVFCSDGSLFDRVTCTNAYYGGTAGVMFIFNEDTPAGLGITYENCTAQLTGNTITLSKDHINGFSGHNNVGGNFGAVIYTDCTAIYVYFGISDPDNNTSVVVTNITLTEVTRGILINSVSAATGGYTINGGSWTATSLDNAIRLSACGGNVVATGMILTCENVSEAIYHAAAGITLTLDSFVMSDTTATVGKSRTAIRVNHVNADLVVDTCQILGANWRQYIYATLANTVKSDYNTFAKDNAGPSTMNVNGVNYVPISTNWLGANIAGVGDLSGTATQQDANSTILA